MPYDTLMEGKYEVATTLYENPQRTVQVYRAVNKETNAVVAVKVIKKDYGTDFALVANEVKILKALRGCPHVVQFYEDCSTASTVQIVMELAGKDLVDVIGTTGLEEEAARQVFLQLLDAVESLHCEGVAHRDLKCENVLFDEGGCLKICDFGLATFVNSPDGGTRILSRRCGTRPYIAPEQLSGGGYDGRVSDIWALGVILFAMLSGCLPFREASPVCRRYVRHSANVHNFPPWTRFSESSMSLVNRLLDPIPHRRATLPEIRAHPWCSPC
eukprot:TRINITY_DN14489_c0_g1_i1.p1 TRINITY_DN14489_c0_g1~~TRINITY_DN14489_c0_g1_i1.p1  ORF type:complete len:272 (-),score=22.24 TRINITY_DN14489_c0_g1_i1:165-980(-)